MEKQFGQMGNHIREIMSMTRNMDMEYLPGILGRSMKENGSMENNMGRGLSSHRKIKEKLDCGRMEGE